MIRFFLRFFLLAAAGAAVAGAGAHAGAAAATEAAEAAGGEITPIGRLGGLDPEAARAFGAVVVEAVTTFYDPEIRTFFVQDGTGAIFVKVEADRAPQVPPRPGDRVRVRGMLTPGNFRPMIDLTSLEPLGSGPPPEPRRIPGQDLLRPDLDCAWVEVDAMVNSTSLGRFGDLVFDLHVEGFPVTAHLPIGAKFTTQPWHLQQRRVRVRGVVASFFNDERQMCGRRLFLPQLSDVIPEDAAGADGEGRLRLTTELLRADSLSQEKVRVRGIVTMVDPGTGLTLRDAAGSMLVRTAQKLDLAPGDLAEAHGYPAMADFRPRLQAMEVRRLGTGGAPEALAFDPRPPYPSRWHEELVTLEAVLVDVIPGRETTTLLCGAAGGERFEARLSGPIPDKMDPAARLRLTGICELIHPGPRSRYVNAYQWRLILRGPEDVAVLRPAPWLTARRAAWLLGGLCAAAFFITLWVLVLRRQVRAQSAVIRRQAGREATMEERQRIARELHDTLEQDLMGVTLLLDGTAQQLENAPHAATGHLTLARQLLRRSREESHSTIRDLRSVALDQLGLPGAMEELLQPIATAGGLTFTLEVSGLRRRLPAVVEHHLLRISHEGVSNAVKHSRAAQVTVELIYALETVRLEIRDNGQGGAFADPTGGSPGFGLQSIRERANKLGAALHIDSPPGGGTRLCLTVPLANPALTAAP